MLIRVHLFVFKDKDVIGISAVSRMKVIAAYLLAVLGGNTSPTADDVKSILESGISAILVITFFDLLSSGLGRLVILHATREEVCFHYWLRLIRYLACKVSTNS